MSQHAGAHHVNLADLLAAALVQLPRLAEKEQAVAFHDALDVVPSKAPAKVDVVDQGLVVLLIPIIQSFLLVLLEQPLDHICRQTQLGNLERLLDGRFGFQTISIFILISCLEILVEIFPLALNVTVCVEVTLRIVLTEGMKVDSFIRC